MSEINFDDLWAETKPALPTIGLKKEYKEIPDGRYQAVVKHAQVDMTKTPHKVSLQYQIVEGEEFKNRIVFINYNLTKTVMPILKSELNKLGVSTDAIKKLSDLNDALKAIIAKPVEIYTKARKYQGLDGQTKTAYNAYVKGEPVTELKYEQPLPPDGFPDDEIISF